MTIDERKEGWISPGHHAAFREICLHALARYRLCCPVYCLMPDHGHLLLIGLEASSDQLGAIKWLRREWNHLLRPVELQRQAYDNVLRGSDRERDAFADLVGYILRNPVREGLVDEWSAWPYSGSCFPGYPKLNPRKVLFWENFWKAVLEQSR